MKSYRTFFIFVISAGVVSVCFAQGPVTESADANAAGLPAFPYTAEITGDNVYVRSGPGTNYYVCGQLNRGERVKVVSWFKNVWSRIVPPTGSFSWISRQYVTLDPANPGIGIVTGDAVRVYAGSEDGNPMHSRTMQLKLDRGEKVKLLAGETGDYYKIAPPASAYLWVSTRYTQPVGAPGEVGPKVEPKTEPKVVVPTGISVEAEKLEEYHALEKRIETERARPIAQQNYVDMKKDLIEIASNEEAGKAARYAEFALKQVKRFELALEVERTIRLQDAQLQQTQQQIERARRIRLAEVQDLGRFAVVGQLQTSSLYGTERGLLHHRVIDASGKILCYTLAAGPASNMDLSRLVGRKVGLLGTIEAHPETGQALVRFTDIVELQ